MPSTPKKKKQKKTGGENVRENSSCKSLWHEQFQWGAQRQQNALEPHSSTSLLCGRVWAWPGRWVRGGRGGEQHLRNGARICCQLSGHRNDGIAGCAFECPWLTNFPPPLVALSIFYIFADIRRPFCGFIIIYSYASGCRNGKIVNRRIYSNDWVQNLKQSNISDLPAKLLNWIVIIMPKLSLNFLTNVKLHYLFFIFLCNESISNALLWVLSIYLSPVRG